MKRKIITLTICLLCGVHQAFAQYNTEFTITDLNDEGLTVSVQKTLCELVNELNTAFAEKRTPKISKMNIDDRTQTSILMLWDNSPFRCDETEIVERAIKSNNEFEIRNIPFIFSELDPDDQYHEVAISFSKSGQLTSFYLTIEQNLYSQVIRSNTTVSDFRRRQMILDYVEQFRTAYNTKDISFLNQVFSDDALIITGRIIKPKATKDMNRWNSPKIEYSRQNKEQYLSKLSGVFKRNQRIRVTFDEIKVLMHPTKSDWYGVTLHQGWTSDSYHDDGWLFLLWDFSDDSHPTIHVRTWQPDKIGDKKLPEEEIFSLDDCNIVD